jgi:hypothetical protein
MLKKTTLYDIAAMLTKQGKEIHDLTETVSIVVKHMATKDDIAALRRELKGDLVAMAQQVNSIETELRGIKRDKLVTRVADLEDEVFGETRA